MNSESVPNHLAHCVIHMYFEMELIESFIVKCLEKR